jgi:hypothetical protein
MPIVEPPAGDFEAEYRGRYQPEPTSHVGVIVQGSVGLTSALHGDDDDDTQKSHDVRLLVGPFWQNVENVVPKVTIDGFFSTSPDEDDYMRWRVRDLTWDTQGEFGPNQDELRIRLKFTVDVQGEHAMVTQLGYYLLAGGRRLGVGGISEPGPVKPQG